MGSTYTIDKQFHTSEFGHLQRNRNECRSGRRQTIIDRVTDECVFACTFSERMDLGGLGTAGTPSYHSVEL